MANVFEHGETEGVRGLANRLNLRYCDTVGDRGYQEDIGEMARVGILNDVEPTVARNLIYGRYDDCNVQIFDLDLAAFDAEPRHPRRSCCLITFAAKFPKLVIGEHNRMTRLSLGRNREWLAFAPDEFRQKFNVGIKSNEDAEALLSTDLMHWLLAGRSDVRIELEGPALLVHTARLPEGDDAWVDLVDFAVGFHQQIPESAWVTYNLFSL